MNRVRFSQASVRSTYWVVVLAALMACTDERYKDAVPGACGRIDVGGNTIVLYGIEVLDCDRFDDVVFDELRRGTVAVGSGRCFLRGEGNEARFTAGGCSKLEDQGFVDWMVPGAVSENAMLPIRNDRGEITANVFVSNGWHASNLQSRLILAGVARASCTVSVEGDTCRRILYADGVRLERYP